ncbi:MAG: hypothetical protein WA823_08770 [Candidatus Acidiferrales bacterium]
MSVSPLLFLHICGGIAGLISGAAAIVFRKGSRRHAYAGSIFVAAMVVLAGSGVILAVLKSQPGNVLGGTLTLYLVATAWLTARRRDRGIDFWNWASLAAGVGVTAFAATYGMEAFRSPTGEVHGYPPGPYFFLGTIAFIGVLGDARVLLRGGIDGAQRLARHLWRMCFALFIASASVFLARAHIFPAFMRTTGMLNVLTVLPLLLLVFWLIRVRVLARKNARRARELPVQPQRGYSLGDAGAG